MTAQTGTGRPAADQTGEPDAPGRTHTRQPNPATARANEAAATAEANGTNRHGGAGDQPGPAGNARRAHTQPPGQARATTPATRRPPGTETKRDEEADTTHPQDKGRGQPPATAPLKHKTREKARGKSKTKQARTAPARPTGTHPPQPAKRASRRHKAGQSHGAKRGPARAGATSQGRRGATARAGPPSAGRARQPGRSPRPPQPAPRPAPAGSRGGPGGGRGRTPQASHGEQDHATPRTQQARHRHGASRREPFFFPYCPLLILILLYRAWTRGLLGADRDGRLGPGALALCRGQPHLPALALDLALNPSTTQHPASPVARSPAHRPPAP